MVFRTSLVGRKRSFQKLQKAFGRNARLEAVQLNSDEPLALWSMLRPRVPVIALPGESSLDREHCIAVYYTLVGKVPEKVPGEGNCMVSGVWGLAVGDHAIGRGLHRSAPSSVWETAVTAVLAEAHHNLLRLDCEAVIGTDGKAAANSFLLKAGEGAFICVLRLARNIQQQGGIGVLIEAKTWISADMMHANQVPLLANGKPGDRMVDTLLAPSACRRTVTSEEGKRTVEV